MVTTPKQSYWVDAVPATSPPACSDLQAAAAVSTTAISSNTRRVIGIVAPSIVSMDLLMGRHVALPGSGAAGRQGKRRSSTWATPSSSFEGQRWDAAATASGWALRTA